MNDDESTDMSKIDNLREKIAKEEKKMIHKIWLNNAYRRIITGIIILGTVYLGLTFGSDLTQDGIITILLGLGIHIFSVPNRHRRNRHDGSRLISTKC